MKLNEIKKELNKFEDSDWVEKHGNSKSDVIAEFVSENMDKDELIESQQKEIEAIKREVERLKEFKRSAKELIRISPVLRNSQKWKQLNK